MTAEVFALNVSFRKSGEAIRKWIKLVVPTAVEINATLKKRSSRTLTRNKNGQFDGKDVDGKDLASTNGPKNAVKRVRANNESKGSNDKSASVTGNILGAVGVVVLFVFLFCSAF